MKLRRAILYGGIALSLVGCTPSFNQMSPMVDNDPKVDVISFSESDRRILKMYRLRGNKSQLNAQIKLVRSVESIFDGSVNSFFVVSPRLDMDVVKLMGNTSRDISHNLRDIRTILENYQKNPLLLKAFVNAYLSNSAFVSRDRAHIPEGVKGSFSIEDLISFYKAYLRYSDKFDDELDVLDFIMRLGKYYGIRRFHRYPFSLLKRQLDNTSLDGQPIVNPRLNQVVVFYNTSDYNGAFTDDFRHYTFYDSFGGYLKVIRIQILALL